MQTEKGYPRPTRLRYQPHRSTLSLPDYLLKHNIPALSSIDTRLTKKIPISGAKRSIFTQLHLASFNVTVQYHQEATPGPKGRPIPIP